METTRLLLPFTHGVHTNALEYAVLLAKSRDAILVPLSLISVPVELRAKGARLEHIQQSKDFLGSVQHQATKYAVSVEPMEIFTRDTIASVNLLAQEMSVEGVLLFVCDGKGVLLNTNEVKHIITQIPGKHHLVRLPASNNKNAALALLKRCSNLLSGQAKRQTVQV